MIERENELKGLPEQRAKQGPSNTRRAVLLMEFMGSLVLAIALTSVVLAAAPAPVPDRERSNEASVMRWAGQGTEPDQAFVRSVASPGQSLGGYAVAGPLSTPLGTLSMSPTEADAYARSLAPGGQAGFDADTARWVRLGEAFEAARAEAAAATTANRFTAPAAYYGMDTATLIAHFGADAERWFKSGEAYDAALAEAAETAMTNRYKALAAYYGVDTVALASDFDTDTLRWFRLGEAYAATRAEAAATAMTSRYKALADYCNGRAVMTQALLCRADTGQPEP